jgi:exopolysaccharide biosynthesis polyprenyl glycosylphosphotransferase
MRDPLARLAPGIAPKVNLAGDCALIVVGALVATEGPDHAVRWADGLFVAAVGLTVWITLCRALHQYDVWKDHELLGDLVLTGVLLLLTTAAMVLPGVILPEYAPVVTLSHLAGVLWPGGLWLRAVMPGVRTAVDVPIDVLVLGTGPLARHTGLTIRQETSHRKVLGYLAFEGETADPRLDAPILGAVEDLTRVLGERALDEVYIAGHAVREGEAIQQAIATCERFGTPFALPATEFRLSRARPVEAKVIEDGYLHFVTVDRKPLQSALKRAFDILMASTVLLLLSPLLAGVAVAIKVTSRGPVFFKQVRVGLHGRHFHMLKFRSMVQDAEKMRAALEARNEQSGPVFKIERDPRITPVGRFIRKLSIDELPQFFNVLRGEMAIVGPRPPIPGEVAQYEPWQRRRLSIRPGITCVWQVSGRNKISFEQWMYLDMQYIDHWSLWTDIRLIFKTIPAVLAARGAS